LPWSPSEVFRSPVPNQFAPGVARGNRVNANGSQLQTYGRDDKPLDGKFTNHLNLVIVPIWGFAE
jgi:hypothetical protein